MITVREATGTLALLLCVALPIDHRGAPRFASGAEPADLRVAAVGDVLFGRYLPSPAGPRYSPVTRAPAPFAAVAPVLRAADLAFANLETPVMDPPAHVSIYRTLTFRADPARLLELRDAGFDVLSLANNHTTNLGARGAAETRRHVDAAGLSGVGAGATQGDALAPAVLHIAGQRVAVLARTLWIAKREAPRSSPAQREAPRSSPAQREAAEHGGTVGAVAYVRHRDFFHDVPKLVRALRQPGPQQVDHVIVSLHWGAEGEPHPSGWQRRAARALIDAGASLVLGHHPHVLQDFERYHGGLIAYSLGNFLFDNQRRGQRETAILLATLRPRRPGVDPAGAVGPVTLVPVILKGSADGQEPRLATGSEHRALRQRLQALTSQVADVTIEPDPTGPQAREAPLARRPGQRHHY